MIVAIYSWIYLYQVSDQSTLFNAHPAFFFFFFFFFCTSLMLKLPSDFGRSDMKDEDTLFTNGNGYGVLRIYFGRPFRSPLKRCIHKNYANKSVASIRCLTKCI